MPSTSTTAPSSRPGSIRCKPCGGRVSASGWWASGPGSDGPAGPRAGPDHRLKVDGLKWMALPEQAGRGGVGQRPVAGGVEVQVVAVVEGGQDLPGAGGVAHGRVEVDDGVELP